MENEKSKTSVVSILFLLIEIAFVAVISLRQYIFAPDSVLFNLYEADLSEQLLVRILKCIYAICMGAIMMKVSSLISDSGQKLKNNKTKTSLLLIGNVIKYISAVVVIFVCLSAWGIDTTAIATGAGVVTLIVGLGCQSMISDIVAGIFLLFEGDVQVGDVVVVNGWRGTVQQIGLRRTKIIDANGNINIINNSSISNIINNTKELSLSVVQVNVDYNENIENMENVLKNNLPIIKEKIPAIVEGPFYLGISALAPSYMTISLYATTKEQSKFQVERDMNRELKLLFDKEDITIASEQIAVYQRTNEREQMNLTAKEILETKKFLEEQREHAKNINEEQK